LHPEDDFLEIPTCYVGLTKIGLGQVELIGLSTTQVYPSEIRLAQIFAPKISVTEVLPPKIPAPKVSLQIRNRLIQHRIGIRIAGIALILAVVRRAFILTREIRIQPSSEGGVYSWSSSR